MNYYLIDPEVAGNIAFSKFVDRRSRPPKILKLKYEFDGWLGDDIIESIATFIVTERLRDAIEKFELTGAIFDNVEVSKSTQFIELYGKNELPKFYWLKVVGDVCNDDFSISSKSRLIISSRALDVLRTFQLKNAVIEVLI